LGHSIIIQQIFRTWLCTGITPAPNALESCSNARKT